MYVKLWQHINITATLSNRRLENEVTHLYLNNLNEKENNATWKRNARQLHYSYVDVWYTNSYMLERMHVTGLNDGL